MGAKNAAFILNLKVKKSASAGEVHNAIIEELIRASNGINGADNSCHVDNHDGGEERPKNCDTKHLPFPADLVQSVAVSPPYCGIVLQNGKACRFKITDDGDLSWLLNNDTSNEVNAKESATPKYGDIENSVSKESNFNGQEETSSQKNEENLLLNFEISESGVPSKRQRLDDEESSGSTTLQTESTSVNPEYEQSFEERRFTELIELGLSEGCRLERQHQTESSQADSFADSRIPLAPTNPADESNLDFSACAITSEVIPGTTFPIIHQMEEPEETSMLIEEACNLSFSENSPVFFPVVPQISGNPSEDMTFFNQEQNERKRPYEYPAGFRTMSDKLLFMQRGSRLDSAASTSTSKKPNTNTEKTSNPISGSISASSVEWIQCDCKDVQFVSISALYSEFILVSKGNRKLWSWPIPRSKETNCTTKAGLYLSSTTLGLCDEEVKLIDCNVIRASVVTKTGKVCSFFDPILAGSRPEHAPSLIKKLTLPATTFKALENEVIIDLKCGHFYSVILTLSGKVFWWGLAPDELRKLQKTRRQIRRNSLDVPLNVGDIVALKERKEELGALVIKNQFIYGPMLGKVVKIQDLDKGSDSSDRRQYTVELVKCKPGESKASTQYHSHKTRRQLMSGDLVPKEVPKSDWSSDEVIFLEERAGAVGSVVAVDGNYVVVNPKGSLGSNSEQKLKVCLKTSLTKVTDSNEVIVEGATEFLVNEDRYDQAIRDKPVCVVDPGGTETRYNGFRAVAVSATKHGLAMLLNRTVDSKAFLVQPFGLKEDNSKVFTCSTKKRRVEKEFLTSDGNVTSEFESVSAKQCMLDITCEDVAARECDPTASTIESLKGPTLMTLSSFDCSILLDRNSCLYPIKFSTCLLQSGSLEALPFRILMPVEARYGSEIVDEVTISVVAVPRKMELAPVIIHCEREKFDEILRTITDTPEQEQGETSSSKRLSGNYNEKELQCLFEKCSGNQNILHLCASNISSRQNDGKAFEAGSETDSDEVYMLDKILGCGKIKKTVIELLTEKDSLGCTPFLAAIWTKNFKAALSILRFVLGLGKEEPTLFQAAICSKSLFGMTPLHHLVFNTSKLQPKYLLKNALVVSNIPANYSPRMLLQLFKERYSSAYRACIPIPQERWTIRTAREKYNARKSIHATNEQPLSQMKSATFIPRYERTTRPLSTIPQARPRYGILNRADALRATAKEGLIMFSDLEEMNQALAEMDRFQLLCKDDRAPAGLTSVARYILQVHRADDPSSETRSKDGPAGASRPTRHTIPPPLRASTLRLPRGHLFSHAALTRDIAHVRHILPQTITGARLILPREVIVSQSGGSVHASQEVVSEKPDQTNARAEEDTEMANLADVFKELLNAYREAANLVNDQQETALAFYLKNSKRLMPEAMYDLFSKYGPCHSQTCVINKLKQMEIKKHSLERLNESANSVSQWHLVSMNETNEERVSHSSVDLQGESGKGINYSGKHAVNGGHELGHSSQCQTSTNFINETGIARNVKDVPNALSILDEDLPHDLPSVGVRPTPAMYRSSYEGMTPEGLDRLMQIAADRARDRTSAAGYEHTSSLDAASSSTASENAVVDKCIFFEQFLSISEQQAKTFMWMISVLAGLNGSVLGTMYGSASERAVSRSLGRVDIEDFDDVISHLMSNPVPCVVRTFVITLLDMFPSSNINAEFCAKIFQTTDRMNFTKSLKRDRSLVKDFEVIGTYRSFLSSVVRQLSLFLSKERDTDSRLRHKIGRFARSQEENADKRAMKRIRSTLRAFSWLAVMEILKAAETTITPVRLGISKAQPKGIFAGMSSANERPSMLQSAHFMSSILGTNPRVAGSTRRTTEALGCSSHIRRASRRADDTKASLKPTRLVFIDPYEDESSIPAKDSPAGISRDTAGVPSDSVGASRDSLLVSRDGTQTSREFSGTTREAARSARESPGMSRDFVRAVTGDSFQQPIGLQNNQSMMSPLAWTLDGYFRVSDVARGRQSLPIPDFLDRRPDPGFVPSVHAGNYYLAQMFSRLVKEAVDLASDLLNKGESKFCNNVENMPELEFRASVENELIHQARNMLSKTWDWLNEVMNSIEDQLRAGEKFDTERFVTRSLKMDPSISDASSLGRPPSFSQSYVSRPEEYLMFILRANDHSSTNAVFPIMDLMSYSHVTVVLDAYLYMLKNWPAEHLHESHTMDAGEAQPTANDTVRGRELKFFGLDAATEFVAINFEDAKSRVLKKARSPQFWLIPKQPELVTDKGVEEQKNWYRDQCKLKWKHSISAFAKLFLAEPPGMERDCFLTEHAGSSGRIARFQRALGSLKDDCLPKTLTEESKTFTANIRRGRFLADGLKALLPLSPNDNHPYSTIKVRFEGEEGTGPGVNRGFFTGFASTLTGEMSGRHSPILFHQPGQLPEQAHVYCPRRKRGLGNDFFYKLVYTGIGRFIGLSLWFNQAIPLIFTRPVLKFILDKEDEIIFEDLAFHNTTLYSSFSQMIVDANSAGISEKEFQEIYDSTFEFSVDGTPLELVPGGASKKVTKENAMELARLSAMALMVESVRPDLEAMRCGLQQIIPKELLVPLSAEDFQLLLSGGVGDVDFARLKSIIRFNNSRSCSKESLERIKGWFWSIVREMAPSQRMKLLYFLTGSSVLPAFNNTIGNSEELAVSVDITGQSCASLPVASTCGQRLSLPLYESKKELKKKLLTAIECETYGLG